MIEGLSRVGDWKICFGRNVKSRSDWLSDVLVLTGSMILGYRLVSLTYLDDFKRVR